MHREFMHKIRDLYKNFADTIKRPSLYKKHVILEYVT